MNKTKNTQPLSGKTKTIILIVAICVLAAVILGIALNEILKPATKTPGSETPDNSGSSSLTIKNGDFVYTKSNSTSFPREAQNWSRYTAPTGTDTSLVSIEDSQKALMGIIDTDAEKWDEVSGDLSGMTVTNPKTHDDSLDTNVYMIASREATTASILSDSFSISSNTSVKITVWLNTSQLTDGSKAVIMLTQSTTNIKEDNWYAYDFEIGKETGANENNGWISKDFYVFNRNSSSKSIRISVGLGNVYDSKLEDDARNGEGVLFVDDITFETVTANDYRKYADGENGGHNYKIIEASDTTDKDIVYKELVAEGNTIIEKTIDNYDDYLTEYVNKVNYAPFTKKDDFVAVENGMPFTIYQISNNGSVKTPVGLRLKDTIAVKTSDTDKDHHHISFWVRVDQANVIADINILLQKKVGDKYETLDSKKDGASGELFTEEVTGQTIATDTNNGWKKFDIYIKPSSAETEISVLITLGSAKGYEADKYVPNGTMYVTAPTYELIAQKDYSNASSGTTSKKISLVGVTASMGVTNGTFSNTTNTAPTQPASWTPVFAGQNAIYKDGKGDEAFVKDLNTTAAAVKGSGIVKDVDSAPSIDDSEKGVLKLVNNAATSQGYLSSNISLSAKSVYVLSVLAKVEGNAKPFIYLINNNKDRADAVIAKIEKTAVKPVDDEAVFNQDSVTDGWQRYYIVVVTGDDALTVRMGLFNGSIDGSVKPDNGATVYYDQADSTKIGSYSLEKDTDNEDAKLYNVTYASESGYTAFDKLELADADNVVTIQPTDSEWEKIRTIPEDNDDDDHDHENTEEKQPVDLALLFSVISSVALVAALLIVVVIRIYRNKNKNKKQ